MEAASGRGGAARLVTENLPRAEGRPKRGRFLDDGRCLSFRNTDVVLVRGQRVVYNFENFTVSVIGGAGCISLQRRAGYSGTHNDG